MRLVVWVKALAEQVSEEFQSLRVFPHDVRFRRQSRPNHALDSVGGPFHQADVREALAAEGALGSEEEELAAILSIRAVANKDLIRKECTVQFDSAGRLVEIEEKPKEPWNDLKPCGMYFFERAVFDAIAQTPPSALRGEVEITDSIQTLVKKGLSVGKANTVKWDVNLNLPADLLLANLVELRRRDATHWIAEDATIEDGVHLHEVVVGPRAHVQAGARLHHCVVLEDVTVPGQTHLEGCILGRDFVVEGCLPGILPMLQMFHAKEMRDA